MIPVTRRQFIQASSTAVLSAGGAALLGNRSVAKDNTTGQANVEVLNPRGRVPLSFVIDDSTCLVNMGHYCMPQFAEAWPDREIYKKPWKTWPQEIPDAFVREFGEWCAAHGVKGKYSIVPYPACVGWLDRGLPGWSRGELQASLKLVRELMLPHWDIHPEMITHTRVIDVRTGRPVQGANAATMENSYPQTDKSVDELASYLAYALRVLKNCDLPCEGITTPGGFGSRVKDKLPIAVFEAVRDVYGCELPHYFKYVSSGEESTQPKLEFIGQPTEDAPRVTVNVPAATGDWFGGWDGDRQSEGHRYANDDATSGRMVELIQQGQPAIMLCHWPGMYTQGTKAGFASFQKVVLALRARFSDQTLWMKMSDIARYWAAKELTRFETKPDGTLVLNAPFASADFTMQILGRASATPVVRAGDNTVKLAPVAARSMLEAGTYLRQGRDLVTCFNLPKGESRLEI